jgi:hypothetical protein
MTPMQRPPVWVSDLAARFWAAAGPPPPLPRDLAAAVTCTLMLGIVARPALTLVAVSEYLRRHRVPVPPLGPDRPLRAALYCWNGSGFLFLDSADPPDERRFSLAHEIAHFLRDYDAVRRRVAESVGESTLSALDGLRPPTDDERLAAVLRTVQLTPHCHFMSRDPAGRPSGEAERRSETDADRLAFELLAPVDALLDDPDPARLESRLIAEFGLPPAAARSYVARLVPPPPPVGGLITRLRDGLGVTPDEA